MIEYTVVCDRCGSVVGADTTSPAEAHRRAVEGGILVRHDGRDICIGCSKAPQTPSTGT